jgi:RNA polymerase sigma-70 factor, ECF subfamily
MLGTREWPQGFRAIEGPAAGTGPGEEMALVRAGQAGDRAALERLLAAHKQSLYALCRGILGSADDAEDAVQETFLHALRGLGRFRGEAAFRTWLCRIAIHICLKWKASRSTTSPWDETVTIAVTDRSSAEDLALRHLQMTEALRTLLPRHRAILLLRELEGWSVPEIGTAMGWNAKRVQNELYKARCALAAWRDGTSGKGDER